MFITYNTFLKAEYASRTDNKVVLKAYQKAGGFKAFKRQYIKYNGFGEYLTAIRGASLTAIQVYHLARMFFVYGQRKPSDIPQLLTSCCRQYQLELPCVYGILTEQYWASRFVVPIQP